MKALLVFPHQLFEDHPGFELKLDLVALTEDPLFFGDARYTSAFHHQKILFHRASMQAYAESLKPRKFKLAYFEQADQSSVLINVIESLVSKGVKDIYVSEVVDFVLSKRLESACAESAVGLHWLATPGFINTNEQNSEYRQGKKRWYMADYYKWQRRRLGILVDKDENPVGGKWSFDEENRKKLPKKKIASIPALPAAIETATTKSAQKYIDKNFKKSLGVSGGLLYPTTHEDARDWLSEFLNVRFAEFGPFEDAIVEDENWLYHSVLTPMLNTGLLTPVQVVEEALKYAGKHDTPMASVEGFIRQVIGWREFMRATYTDLGVTMRTSNHWQHHNKMPAAFYDATTGVLPVDNVIKRVLETGYCHHIERLMVLGGFMFLCEIEPDDIYLWFMELFIDSYDWVMVPNVYAMSQNADGGLITTKPYFSGSNYIRKMSHYPTGDWCDIWDALYWRWIFKHSDDLRKNPRWAMMVRNGEKMDGERKQKLLADADAYLGNIHA